MRSLPTSLLIGVIVVLAHDPLAHSPLFAQTLQSLRNEVRSTPPVVTSSQPAQPSPPSDQTQTPADRPTRDNKSSFRTSYSSDDDDSISLKLFFAALSSPYWVPRGIAHDVDYRLGYFHDYPYADEIGNLTENPETQDILGQTLLRLRLEAGTDFEQLSVTGGQILLDMPWRMGLDSEFAYRNEEWSVLSDKFTDNLWTGDINFVFRFAQNPRAQMRLGAGINYLIDDDTSELGFNLTYGGDFFFKDPFVLSVETDLGSLGDAGLLHARATLGVVKRHTEFYTGFDFYRVGSVKVPSLVAGIRLWF